MGCVITSFVHRRVYRLIRACHQHSNPFKSVELDVAAPSLRHGISIAVNMPSAITTDLTSKKDLLSLMN